MRSSPGASLCATSRPLWVPIPPNSTPWGCVKRCGAPRLPMPTSAVIGASGRLHSQLHSHQQRQDARCQRAGYLAHRGRGLLRHGSGLSGLWPPVRNASGWHLLRHARQVQLQCAQAVFGGKTLVFLTNNTNLPAHVIAQLYKNRWQVELFFKWIKQHLRIKKFLGTSKGAAQCDGVSSIKSFDCCAACYLARRKF